MTTTKVNCPQCRCALAFAASWKGEILRCPSCASFIRVGDAGNPWGILSGISLLGLAFAGMVLCAWLALTHGPDEVVDAGKHAESQTFTLNLSKTPRPKENPVVPPSPLKKTGEAVVDLHPRAIAVEERPAKAAVYPPLVGEKVPAELPLAVGEAGEANPAEPKANAVTDLIPLLQHQNVRLRMRTIQALGQMGKGAKDAVEPLGKCLRHPLKEVRVLTAQALGQIGADAVPLFIRECQRPEVGSITQAAYRLAVIGPAAHEAVPILQASLKHREEDIRAMCAFALGEIGTASWNAGPALVAQLGDKKESARKQAFDALRKIGPDILPALRAGMQAANPIIRQQSADVLAALGPAARAALPELVKNLKCKDAAVRRQSALAVGAMQADAKEAVPNLIDLRKDADATVRAAAFKALGDIGPDALQAVPILIDAFTDPVLVVRMQAVTALAEIGPSAVNFLRQSLESNNQSVRVSAISALGEMGPGAKDALEALTDLLKDPYPAVRATAALAVGKIHDPKSVASLLVLLDDAQESVRLSAAVALVHLQPNDVAILNRLVQEITKNASDKVAPQSGFTPGEAQRLAQAARFLDFFIFRNSFRFGDGLSRQSEAALATLGYEAIPAMVNAYNKLQATGAEGKIREPIPALVFDAGVPTVGLKTHFFV